MPTNHTPNYALSLWEASDQVTRTEFNENHTKLDAALQSLNTALAGKAGQSAVTGLQGSLNTLQGSLSSLQGTVSQKQNIASALKIAVGTYIGSGTAGAGSPNTLDFSSTLGRAPALVVVQLQGDDDYCAVMVRGASITHATTHGTSNDRRMYLTWSGTRLSWYAAYPGYQLNAPNTLYCYFAVG